MQMKKIGVFFMVLAFAVFLTGPVWAADNPRPAATKLYEDLAERHGQSMPQATYYYYLVDLVTNAYSYGFSTVFVLTNYNMTSRIRVQGFVIPKGAMPGSEVFVDIWLNPYEVRYVDLGNYLGNENGWALLRSNTDFGCGALIFNSTDVMGMTWIQPWNWTN
jgi:hypothetical protein